jgi:hypothetical protein
MNIFVKAFLCTKKNGKILLRNQSKKGKKFEIMETQATMSIKDNTFSRQFETFSNGNLVSVEYSFQEKKIFLTRLNVPENFTDEDFISDFLKNIMAIALERKLKVVPILPKIVVFFKKNPIYKELLPPGIRL